VGATCAALLPHWLKSLLLSRSRGFMPEFFDRLSDQGTLSEICIRDCHGLDLSYICKLPRNLQALDLSHSGKSLPPDALMYLPRHLKELKLNGWQQLADSDLAHLPSALHLLEIEGWNVTDESVSFLATLPLTHLSLAQTAITHISSLPKHLKKLSL